ncbi:hypothetical protein ACL9Z5_000536 [Acinetobacter calcoaceticus]
MEKELINKILVAFVISMIVSITTCGIAYLWDRDSINVSFVKDIFSIVMSILAPYAAVILFSLEVSFVGKFLYDLNNNLFF